MEEKSIPMEIIDPHAAGIDVGSRSHWAAISQLEEGIREFGVFNEDLFALADWFTENKIKTIAMESTGTYWQNLYAVLISKGFEVILCNGKFTKNIKGKKTDVKDCQWIQKLHSLGLLTSSFLPDGQTEQLRTYCRHRANLIHSSASTSKKMQMYLRLLNLRLDVVVNDICGLTGLKIIQAFCDGETNPERLASLRHYNCRKSEKEIAKALQSNGRKDYMFALKQELETFGHLQKKMEQCDIEIEKMLNQIIENDGNKKQHYIESKPHKRINKNTPKNIDLNLKSYQMFEGNLKDSTPLRDFFQRINFRKGRVSAISATARKLAVIIWNMVVKNTPYINPEGYLYLDLDQKRKLGIAKRIKKQIDKFDLKPEDIGFDNSLTMSTQILR